MKRRTVFLGLVGGALSLAGPAAAQRIKENGIGRRMAVGSVGEIPRRLGGPTFLTYSLFVATQRGASRAEQALSQEFDRFGDIIGERNLAVFVRNPATGDLDVTGGRSIVDLVNQKYGLSMTYDKGPYVLLLSSHPGDRKATGETAVVVEFGNQSQSEIAASLRRLSDLVLAKGPFQRRPGLFKAFWQDVAVQFNQRTEIAGRQVSRMFLSA